MAYVRMFILFSISRKVEHPSYSGNNNDFSLLRLSSTFDFTDTKYLHVAPACLPTLDEAPGTIVSCWLRLFICEIIDYTRLLLFGLLGIYLRMGYTKIWGKPSYCLAKGLCFFAFSEWLTSHNLCLFFSRLFPRLYLVKVVPRPILEGPPSQARWYVQLPPAWTRVR